MRRSRMIAAACVAAIAQFLTSIAFAGATDFYFPDTNVTVQGQAMLLAIDDVSLPLKRNLAYFITKPTVRKEPVLTPSRDNPDAPDYLATHFYGTVLYDGGKFRMWYYACHFGKNPDWPPELKKQSERWKQNIVPGPLCYAESDDGIHWTKPDLGQLLFKGSRDNNAIALPSALTADACVIKDVADPDPARRYKLAFWSQFDPYDYPTMRLATSPDGITWTAATKAPLKAFLEHASFYRFNGKYFANGQSFLRGESGRNRGRQGAAFLSTDFDHWQQEAGESFALPYVKSRKRDEVHLGVGAASFGNVLVGLYCIWHNDETFTNISGDLGLVVSNDGVHFREPVKGWHWLNSEDSPASPVPGAHYKTILCQANGILDVGDETRIYHGRWRNAGWNNPGMSEKDYYAEVGLATIPRDRWGALGIVDKKPEGSVWSAPVRLPKTGCAVAINGDGVASMRVEVADSNFHLFPDYSAEHSGVTRGKDGLDCPVRWPDHSLGRLAGQTVRFHIVMKRENTPRLYAVYLRAPSVAKAVIPSMESTSTGTKFCMMEAPRLPAPTLLVCAMDAQSTLTTDPYDHTGTLLHALGWNVIALDLPCHGADARPGEPPQLEGWAARVKHCENIVTDWRRRVDDVLAYLVDQGIAKPNAFIAEGTSRGGYMALEAAAANRSIRAVAAYSPVTDLLALREFDGMDNNALARQLSLVNVADKLAERPLWITISGQDTRVGTDKAIEFARRVTAAADARHLVTQVTLRVTPVKGHHSSNADHEQAVQWILGLK